MKTMKIKLNYFSSTGNTLWVTELIKNKLESFGHMVLVYDSVLEKSDCVTDCDLIGFIYPVWGSTLPNPQREIVELMPKSNGQKVFLFGNCGAFTGDTGIYWKNQIKKKGYDVVYADHVFLPINSIFPGFSMFKAPNDAKTKKMVTKAERRIDVAVNNIQNGNRKFRGKGLWDRLGGWGQRSNYDPIVDKFIEGMFIDNERCNKCSLCHRICPQDAISKNEDGNYYIDNSKCILCLKCYNYCPQTAALKDAESIDIHKYTRYKGLGSAFKPIRYR